jgi:hypothetical protein
MDPSLEIGTNRHRATFTAFRIGAQFVFTQEVGNCEIHATASLVYHYHHSYRM